MKLEGCIGDDNFEWLFEFLKDMIKPLAATSMLLMAVIRADTSVDIIDSLSLYDRDNLGPVLDLIHTASESNIQQQQVHKSDQTQPANSLDKYGQFRIVDTIDSHDTVWSTIRRNVLGPQFLFLCVLNLPLTQSHE
ncbi:unnamed protein product [Dovyalis caffra]|uniref:Uncharacterized protein n=1 Tax=Dovyalis caffra TaxID=77055 RepID=A0AAV1R9N9_9ROSI|nr:unnamed protein product [Dovyalis caffra]